MQSFPKFYLIIDDVAWLPRFLPLGLPLVQLRIKDQPDEVVFQQIQQAKNLCAAAGCQLVVNDYWQLALEACCDYIHLGQEDLQAADVGKIKAAGLKLGVSTHCEAEIKNALVAQPDYIALGPVYETRLKQMLWRQQGLGRVSQWKKIVGDMPLVAIGGLTVERAAGVYAAGADCISVVSDVLQYDNPEARLAAWLGLALENR